MSLLPLTTFGKCLVHTPSKYVSLCPESQLSMCYVTKSASLSQLCIWGIEFSSLMEGRSVCLSRLFHVAADITEIQRLTWVHSEQLNANKLRNLEEMDKFLETYNLPRLNHEEIENLMRPIKTKEVESVVKKKQLSTKKSSSPALLPIRSTWGMLAMPSA